LQLVNNEQVKINILNRLRQHHATLNEQIENEKFCQVDLSIVGLLLFDIFNKTLFFIKILFLKLIAYLYPTSDFRHPVTTPALTLLIQAINHVYIHFK
jgi:hypothetical protein